jgi:hypothetical protein
MSNPNLADTPMRAQTLAGQIKQADADTREAERVVEEAQRKLDLAINTRNGCVARAIDLRNERDALAESAQKLIKACGEPEPSEPAPVDQDQCEGKKPDSFKFARENCPHETIRYRDWQDDFECTDCGTRWVDKKDLPEQHRERFTF